MKIARIYERVSTSEQDLTRQADIEKTAIASGFYIAGELQKALDKALGDATDAREAKATLTGELKSLKLHNDQLAALLAGKNEPAAVKSKNTK